VLAELRRGNSAVQGPAPLDVRVAESQVLAFSRGECGDYFVLLNFGGWAGDRSLAQLDLPYGTNRELWNSTWPAFAIASENEGEHTNGGRDARLSRLSCCTCPTTARSSSSGRTDPISLVRPTGFGRQTVSGSAVSRRSYELYRSRCSESNPSRHRERHAKGSRLTR
jgi:hypothetical protein